MAIQIDHIIRLVKVLEADDAGLCFLSDFRGQILKLCPLDRLHSLCHHGGVLLKPLHHDCPLLSPPRNVDAAVDADEAGSHQTEEPFKENLQVTAYNQGE